MRVEKALNSPNKLAEINGIKPNIYLKDGDEEVNSMSRYTYISTAFL
jgi:hypothetical protein